MDTGEMIFYVICCVVAYVLTVPFHEAGHLLCGLLTGYRFSSFRIFSWVWTYQDGKIHFQKSPTASFIGGQCLMVPPENEKEFKFVLYNLGGVLINFLLSAISLFVLMVRPKDIWNMPFLSLLVMNLVVGLMNIIPFTINDGRNILKALQSKRAKHGMYILLKVNAEMAEGKRLRDYNETDFTLCDDDDFTNDFVYSLAVYAAGRFEDLGEHDKMIKIYDRLDLKKLPAFYANAVRADYLYYYIIHNPDYEKAKELYQTKKFSKFLKMPLPSIFRTQLAYDYFVLGEKEKARDNLPKLEELVKNTPSKGTQLLEQDALDFLKQKITAAELA
ncbi:M50 family metallopeptidase [Scatolibacter rhodanostii]|uniref:M50 family metallopeptidase n=1 Tax=Scatolibacter rhodanostii TaxID=2014781 RepID=UPI000C08B7DC|nr:M50 family metallopeptidase [Scatolibacter rhodanostii]